MRARGLTAVQRVSLESLERRLAAIEAAQAETNSLMRQLTGRQSGSMGTPRMGEPHVIWPFAFPLLVGHAEIARFVRKSQSSVRRYARSMAFPAMRFGRHVVSHPKMIFDWLWAVEKGRLRRRGIIK